MLQRSKNFVTNFLRAQAPIPGLVTTSGVCGWTGPTGATGVTGPSGWPGDDDDGKMSIWSEEHEFWSFLAKYSVALSSVLNADTLNTVIRQCGFTSHYFVSPPSVDDTSAPDYVLHYVSELRKGIPNGCRVFIFSTYSCDFVNDAWKSALLLSGVVPNRTQIPPIDHGNVQFLDASQDIAMRKWRVEQVQAALDLELIRDVVCIILEYDEKEIS